jgi:3-methyladenine DNA glycosylase AlkC
MEPLKYIYNDTFFRHYTAALKQVLPAYRKPAFDQLVFTPAWETMELKQRMHHLAVTLHSLLPGSYPEQLTLLLELAEAMRTDKVYANGLACMFLPEFIQLYGQEHFKLSVKAMEQITSLASCEFAVRPFIVRYPEAMLAQMLKWTRHKSVHVRRLASEGSRPRLPWAIALPVLKKDPTPILPILEALKDDPEEYVRRSVANSLNDIAKDNAAVTLQIAREWIGVSTERDKLLKHACRTLLKQGDIGALALFALEYHEAVTLDQFKVHTPKVPAGGALEFSFALHNSDDQTRIIRLEYGMHYLRANGTHARKVFKISERSYGPGEKVEITRKQSFKPITTRVYYPGEQKVSVIINGREYEPVAFTLKG